MTGGKHYLRTKTQSITDSSSILADRRMTSIRQQADQIRECGDSEMTASPSTVFRKRQKVRSTALSSSLKELRSANAIQLCYDGQIDIKNKVERYVLLGKFNNGQLSSERVIAVKSFISGTSVTSDVLVNAIIDNCGDLLQNAYSVMADTTAINTGKKSGVNKRLEQYFTQHMGRDIHVLECLFHVNEIYFNHMIKAIEGKKKGPGALEEGSLRNRINNLGKPDSTHVISRNELPFVSIITIAKTHLKANLEWFLDQKKNKKDDLRNDQMCLLILTCSLFMDVPDQLQLLLFYKQETTRHSRWITTASGYIRLFLFQEHDLSAGDMDNLKRILSYIASVYVPSFMMIHVRRAICDGPFITLFQRDLLLSFEELDNTVCQIVMKYYLKHASNWICGKNVALSLYSDNPPLAVDAVKNSNSLPSPGSVDQSVLLLKRSSTRRIGLLRNVQDSRVNNSDTSLHRTDIKLHAYLSYLK